MMRSQNINGLRGGWTALCGLLLGGVSALSAGCGGAPEDWTDLEGFEDIGEAELELDVEPSSLSVGGDHTCAIRAADKAVFCWGLNNAGQLGDGTTTTRSAPVQVRYENGTPFTGAVQVSAGAEHTCAVVSGGAVYCWGSDKGGRLGNGDSQAGQDPNRLNPVPVLVRQFPSQPLGPGNAHIAFTGVTRLSVGLDHACAVKNDSTAWCWGSDAGGRIGDVASGGERNEATPVSGQNGAGQLSGVARISAGDFFTCAVTSAGHVLCWGTDGNIADSSGYLGRGTYTGFTTHQTPAPVVTASLNPAVNAQPPPILTNIVEIDAGSRHTCALATDGGVFCWGFNAAGALGDNTTVTRTYAVPVLNSDGISSFKGATTISVGESFGMYAWHGAHSCAIKNNEAWCWGQNTFNGKAARLAIDGGGSKTPTPALAAEGSPAVFSSVIAVDVGSFHTCAVRLEGTNRAVYCWGKNEQGQLGIRVTDPDSHTRPSRVQSFADAELGGGNYHSCALRGDGGVMCWGRNDRGQLGDGNMGVDSMTPEAVLLDTGAELTGAGDIALGGDHSCAVRKSDGTAWCWGWNNAGQLGNGVTGINSDQAVQVQKASGGFLTGVTKIDAGSAFTCAVDSAGGAWCWGYDSGGQLGNGPLAGSSSKAAQVLDEATNLPLTNAVQVATSFATGCAVKTDGTVACWGSNGSGQLGNGTTVSTQRAVQVKDPSGVGPLQNVVQVTLGGTTACAVKGDGTAWCWGDGWHGRLGDGSTDSSALPVQVQVSAGVALTGVKEIASTPYAQCAIKTSGATYCWGSDWLGQTGTGVVTGGSIAAVVWATPVLRMDTSQQLSSITTLGQSHNMHTCGLQSVDGGSVWCWGYNQYGQLGDGTATNRSKAVKMPGYTNGLSYFTL